MSPAPALLRIHAAIAALLLALPIAAATSAPRPNFVVIMCDDMGFSDLGCYGSEIRTPNLDRLAAGGVRFTQFYNTAKCETSRRSLMTGLWHPIYKPEPGRNFVTIAEVMRTAGYTTLMTGKWHIDGEPLTRGFERYFGHLSGATDFFHGDNTFKLDDQPFTVPKTGFYATDANTDYALRFLDEAAKSPGKPFFLYIAYNAPHYPLQAPRADIERYRGKYRIGWDELRRRRYQRQLELGVISRDWPLSPRPADVRPWDALTEAQKEDQDLKMATFAAMVDRLDQNIGRLVAHLERLGVGKDTVIMFFSDNGGCPFDRNKLNEIPPWEGGGHWTYDAAWAGASNTPFRWYKQNNHEGGIASPMIVHWPAGIARGGKFITTPAHLVDVLPTCMELGGAKRPTEVEGRPIPPLSGRSLAPVLAGGTLPERTLFWTFGQNRGVRTGPWKLVSAVGRPWELYNLDSDRTELKDLARAEPTRLASLTAEWERINASAEAGVRKRRAKGEREP
ncbi:MAG: Arylsulfatase [Verrucomicrobiota bacterium]